MNKWKNPLLLIAGIGISYLGNWMYLVALNLKILNMTGSPAAVAGLFIIRPIAVLLTNTWSGSVIDRINKEGSLYLPILFVGFSSFAIPFLESLWLILYYLAHHKCVRRLFPPSFNRVYHQVRSPVNKRKQFNSIMGLASSGAMVLGPAIAGVIIMYANAVFLYYFLMHLPFSFAHS